MENIAKLEEMQNYIRRTDIPPEIQGRYGIYISELEALNGLSSFAKLTLAFSFGRAKGYRAGRREARRNG